MPSATDKVRLSDFVRACEDSDLGAPRWGYEHDPEMAEIHIDCLALTARWDGLAFMVQVHPNFTSQIPNAVVWEGQWLFQQWHGEGHFVCGDAAMLLSHLNRFAEEVKGG